jgi:hypothetical protein
MELVQGETLASRLQKGGCPSNWCSALEWR